MSARLAPGTDPLPIPLVVHVGFAGTRRLVDGVPPTGQAWEQFQSRLVDQVAAQLCALPVALRLDPRHQICGVSQAAAGGDLIFTRACQALGIPQRIILPQLREDYLAAIGRAGEPDFTEDERRDVTALLASSHIIEERVVTTAPERRARFEASNVELLRMSDVLVCLVRDGATMKPGGTLEVMQQADARNVPVLELALSVDNAGGLTLRPQWHQRDAFRTPALPHELSEVPVVRDAPFEYERFLTALQTFGSATARQHQRLFQSAALVIIGTHVLATVVAALVIVGVWPEVAAVLLSAELVLLLAGFLTHRLLHRTHAAATWAYARLVAQVTRSAVALRHVPNSLTYLYSLPLPESLLPVLRTIDVMHLRLPRGSSVAWEAARDEYIRGRVDHQRNHFIAKAREARGRASLANGAFTLASLAAIIVTFAKILTHHNPAPAAVHSGPTAILGAGAIVLPVLAAGAVSLSAAFDVPARVHVYEEMLHFLAAQRKRLGRAISATEFAAVATETETRLLGETASWYSRRSFSGV